VCISSSDDERRATASTTSINEVAKADSSKEERRSKSNGLTTRAAENIVLAYSKRIAERFSQTSRQNSPPA